MTTIKYKFGDNGGRSWCWPSVPAILTIQCKDCNRVIVERTRMRKNGPTWVVHADMCHECHSRNVTVLNVNVQAALHDTRQDLYV
jgi:polygalacturonase